MTNATQSDLKRAHARRRELEAARENLRRELMDVESRLGDLIAQIEQLEALAKEEAA